MGKEGKWIMDTSFNTSTQTEAIAFLDSITTLNQSEHWPGVHPVSFLKNLKENVCRPLGIYAGIGTNFCGYGALTYLLLQDDPLGYSKLILQLYTEGKADFGKTSFRPSAAIKKVAGTLQFKGLLDIHPAEQLWYLCLADHFKGYLNFFNKKYDPGDEDRFWASCNYAKFNRMVRKLLHYKVEARGADIAGPWIINDFEYIKKKLETGIVVLYINNRILHKKRLEKIKLAVPTHFVVVQKISKADDKVTIVYWDYGTKTLRQLSPYFFRKIIFGISVCRKKSNHED